MGEWLQIGNDISGEPESYSGSEVSLSKDGKIIAISSKSQLADSLLSEVKVYQNSNGNWSQIGSEIVGSPSSSYSGQSISISSDGSIIAIGEYLIFDNNDYIGKTRVFQNIDDTWTQLGQDIDGESQGDFSGRSVSLSSDGKTLAIGAHENDGDILYSDKGHVRIFKFNGSNWEQVGNDIDGEVYGDKSGYAVSLSGDGSIVAIGAPHNNNNSGHVRIFKLNGSNWEQVGNDIDGEDYGSWVGRSLSLSEDGSVVAISDVSWNGIRNIKIYKNNNGIWEMRGEAINSQQSSYGSPLVSLSSDGTVVAIGANGSNYNKTYVYHYFEGSWNQVGDLIYGDLKGAGSNDYSISLSTEGSIYKVAIGGYDSSNFDNGITRIYEINNLLITGPSQNKGDTIGLIDINEGNKDIYTFTANQNVTWTLNGGDDISKFSIDSSTGKLTFFSSPNFINPTDSDLKNDYKVVILATDSVGKTAEQTLTVNVNDYIAPQIIGPSGISGSDSEKKSIEENLKSVFTFQSNEDVTWKLNGGVDSSSFSINKTTGALSFINEEDFESPTDSDKNNEYQVIVRATDAAGFSSDQNITISITDDPNENLLIQGPSGIPGSDKESISLKENNSVIYQFTSNEFTTWSIESGSDSQLFEINKTTGELSFKKPPSFEKRLDNNADNIYELTIKGEDQSGETSNQELTINVLDEYESNLGSASFSIVGEQNLGDYLSIKRNSDDPNGSGDLEYKWLIADSTSSYYYSWSETWSSSKSSYRINWPDFDKYIKAEISYIDNDGYSETVETNSVSISNSPLRNSYFQELGYKEKFGSPSWDTLKSSANEIIWGLSGDDNLSNSYSSSDQYLFGGSGDDTYTIKSGSTAIIYESSNHGYDKVYLGSNYNYGYAATIDNKHIVAIDDIYSDSGVIILNAWDKNIEEISLGGTSYSSSYFLSLLPTLPGYLGNISWDSLKPYIGDVFVDTVQSAIEVFKSSVISLENTANSLTSYTEDKSHKDQIIGEEYHLTAIRDFDGNFHANTGGVSDVTKVSYKYQGLIDVNADGTKEAIYTNKESGRWVTASINSSTGEIDYSDHGQGGTTRVVGIYIDPLVTSGEVEQFGPHDSQRRFQNDLKIDNLIAKTSGDYDGDGFQEVYWKTNDNTAYLRALMHADGNIQYANYQSEEQMSDYLTSKGYKSVISEIIA